MPSNSTAPEIYRVSLSDRATEAMVPSPFSASISEGAEINEAVWAFYQDAKKKAAGVKISMTLSIKSSKGVSASGVRLLNRALSAGLVPHRHSPGPAHYLRYRAQLKARR